MARLVPWTRKESAQARLITLNLQDAAFPKVNYAGLTHGVRLRRHTLGMFGSTLGREYEGALRALYAARATVFSLDITDADYHTFELGLQAVAVETGGFFVRTHLHSRRALDQVADALIGHYVLSTEKPDLDPGTHRIELRLVRVREPSSGAASTSTEARPPRARQR